MMRNNLIDFRQAHLYDNWTAYCTAILEELSPTDYDAAAALFPARTDREIMATLTALHHVDIFRDETAAVLTSPPSTIYVSER